MMHDIRPIRSDADHAWALTEITAYFDRPPARGTADADRFDVLATLIESYEAGSVSIPDADPIDVLSFAITDLGRSQADLAKVLGSRSRASEILSRKRPLTVEMIRRISEAWGLPAEALVARYRDKVDTAA